MLRANVVRSVQASPGVLIDRDFTVGCAEGALRLERVQRAGRAPMDGEAFLRGFALAPGEVLS